MQTFVRGGMVFNGHIFEKSDIIISDGTIDRIVPSEFFSACEHPSDLCGSADMGAGSGAVAQCFCAGSGDTQIDAKDKIIVPGLTDVHVHFREPGFSYKEDIATGTAAALAGGYTDVCTMPNLDPVPDSPEHLKEELEAIESKALIRVHPYGSLTVGEKGEEISDIEAIAENVIAFSDDGRGLASDELMEEAMRRVRACGKLIAAHCEDMSVIGGAHVHDGEAAKYLGIRGITSESEWRMVERDIKLASKTGCPYHVCHVSTAESVEVIRKAKAAGIDVTCETAPHYLLLDETDIIKALEHEKQENLGRFKMNPPLRGRRDREALLEGIADGTIDMIATDHAPHSTEEKARGLLGAPMGVVGLECAFPVLYEGLVKKGVITLEKLVELMTTAPAARFGIKKGIAEGAAADFCIYDLNGDCMVDPSNFRSKGRYTPFEGMKVSAACVATVLGSEIYKITR